MAEKYDAIGLQDLIKEKFSRACRMFYDTPEFAQAARGAWSSPEADGMGLRTMISQMIACNMAMIEKPEIEALLATFPRLAHDVLKQKRERGKPISDISPHTVRLTPSREERRGKGMHCHVEGRHCTANQPMVVLSKRLQEEGILPMLNNFARLKPSHASNIIPLQYNASNLELPPSYCNLTSPSSLFNPNLLNLILGTTPTSTNTLATITAQCCTCAKFKLYVVHVAAQIVARPNTAITYPATL